MKKTFIALFTMLFVGTSLFAQSDLQVLAVVKYHKNESITVRQLKNEVKNFEEAQKMKLDVSKRKELLNTMIDQRLVLQAADKAGITIPDSEIDKQFVIFFSNNLGYPFQSEAHLEQFVKQTFKIDFDDFILQTTGKTKKEFKDVLKKTAIIQQYVVYKNQEELMKVAPTDDQIRMFYEANKTNFTRKDIADLLVVIVPKGDNAGAAKIKANDLREKLSSKKINVEQLKIQSKNGEAGYNALEGLFEKTEQGANTLRVSYKVLLELFKQPENFVSDVIESEDSYQFLSIIKKYDAKMLSISDVVQPGTTITVYDYIRDLLTRNLRAKFLEFALDQTVAELHTPENFEIKKTDAELDKLLNWGD